MAGTRILILGGTSEARTIAEGLAREQGLDVLLSLAGRTVQPAEQAVPVRIGGFGGASGLAAFLHAGRFDLMVDATHPFAARICTNAAHAAAICDIAAFKLCRPAWEPVPGERWREAANVHEAIASLGDAPRRVFLAIGRQEASCALDAPQHYYLLRSVDPIDPPLPLGNICCLLARGPFAPDDEIALLTEHRIEIVVAKNSGGTATYAKIEAARKLGIDVLMVSRPKTPTLPVVDGVEAALRQIREFVASRR